MNDAKKTNDDLKKKLPPELYKVAREKGTEPAFTGKYVNEKRQGMYKCAVCGNELFSSDTKYDSKSGWPSFYEPAKESAVGTASDDSHGMRRTEVVCSKCGSHLGHVFPDGPEPTGQRYCINSVSLELEPESENESQS